MKKSEAALLRIAELKRQQAEGQYQAILAKKRQIDAEVNRLYQQIKSMVPAAGGDAAMAMVQQQYAERLIVHLKSLKRAREELFPALESAQHALQKALFSERQLKDE